MIYKLSITYINKLLTREEFFEKSYKKGKSKGYEKLTRSVLANLDRFCADKYKKITDDIIQDIKKEVEQTNDSTIALKYLQDFIDWLEVDHPDILYKTNPFQKEGRPIQAKTTQAIRNYTSRVRKYMKMCGGVKIDDEDYSDYLVFPADENDEEAEPLEKQEFKMILDYVKTPRRKALFMFMKDTRARILEAMRTKKKYFDLSQDPIVVTLPKSIVKGKRKKRVLYLTRETAPGIRQLLKNLEDEDLVFTDNHNDLNARGVEERAWNRLVKRAGFSEKYSSGHLKKNIHSIGAFCITQIKEATKDPDYAHGYGGHTRYLEQYIRLTEERKIQLFKQAEPYLSLYEIAPEVTDQSERLKEIEEKLEKYQMLDKLIANVEQPKLEELLRGLSKTH